MSLAGSPLRMLGGKQETKCLLLIGTDTSGTSTSKGIYAYSFDTSSGELEQMGLAAEVGSPTFLAMSPDGKFLYSVGQIGEKNGVVFSFVLDRKKARLTTINSSSSKSSGATHVSVDHTGRCVFAANYGGGSAVSFAVDAHGHLSKPVSFFEYKADPARHERSSHAHWASVTPDNQYVLVNDLGLDQIHIHKLDAATAKLTPHDPPQWRSAVGAGPRALHFHPNDKLAYCVNELKPTMNVLEYDARSGTLATLQEVSLVPEGYKGLAAPGDVVFDQQMRFAYVTSRLDDFMATCSIGEDGKLTLIEHTSCGGIRPRHMALDPTDSWLLVANQDSNNVAVFARNKQTGRLAKSGKSFSLGVPMYLLFL